MKRNTKSKTLSLLLALVIVLGLSPGSAWAANTKPVRSAEDFSDMAANGNYILMADIEITAPYGNSSQKFTGTFDGNGHTITLNINDNILNNGGAFSYIGQTGTVKDLIIFGSITGNNNIGGIAGKSEGTIENCYNAANVIGNRYVGGIAGYLGEKNIAAFVENCSNTGNISATASKRGQGQAGGIAGYIQNSSSVISNCCNSGAVTAKTQAGAIAGYCQGTVKNCYWDMTRSAGDKAAGWIAEGNDSTSFSYDSAADAITALNAGRGDGASWKLDDSGIPVLDLQSDSEIDTTPKLTLDRSDATLYANGGAGKDSVTLTAKTENIPDDAEIKWTSDNDAAVKLEQASDNKCILVKAARGGTATVTAEVIVGEETLTASSTIAVWPFVTTVEIGGTVAVGQTVKAQINVLGGGEVNYSVFPVTVQWRYKDSAADTTWKDIQTGQELAIPAGLEGKYLSFTFRYQNEDKSPSSPSLVKAAGTTEPDPQPPETDKALEKALTGYTMRPACGTDANVNRVLEGYLTGKDLTGYIASVKSVEEVYGGAGIAENGDITYFYADPNTTPAIRFGSYRVTFALSKDGLNQEYTIPVILYWDMEKAKETMRQEISSKVILDSTTPVTENMILPKVVDSKKWALISWSSSDEDVISISSQNQTTADTLFDPYVGVVKRGKTDQTVTLTATFTFQLTNDAAGSEAPITLINTYPVTVKALDTAREEEIRNELLAKLDAGFTAKGLTDAATGEKLTPDENSVYTAANDIQFPTTRDFGVDGKYYPVTITTSDSEILKAPDVNNAARVGVYRPGPGQKDAEGTITVTLHDRDTSTTASREFKVKVPALTQDEIDRELALMERVKAAYFEGLKGKNTAKDNVRTDLTPFFEVYEQDDKLVWVHTNAEKTGRGIVPVPIEGWEDLELWRLFKSSNPNVINHENLLVTRQAEAKAVTITSRLSSETLGRYGELYVKNPAQYPQYEALAPLYYQEATTGTSTQPKARTMIRAAAYAPTDTILVRGTKDPDSAVPVVETLNNITFSLTGLDGEVWIAPTTLSNLDESSTVYDVFTRMLTDNGCTATRVKGTYIKAISGPLGALAEKEYGDDSGWLYRVNGRIPDTYMGACPLHSGDTIQVFYTRDAEKDDPSYSRPSGGNSSGSNSSGGNSSPGGKTEQPNQPSVKVETSGHGDTYIVTLPKDSKGPQLVTIPNVKQGQLVVVVHADGREEVIKKAILEEGRAKFLLEQNASVKVVNYTNPFSDVNSSAWYASAVDFAAGRELFAGVSRNIFAPNLPLSRGMLAAVLCRLEDASTQKTESVFTDVAEGAWYEQGITWAAEAGIVSGYGDGRFGPNDEITREQLAVMLFRYAQLLNMSTGGWDSLTGFSDTASVSPWAQDAVAWAVDSGIINGLPNGMLAPSRTTTRAEASAMLQRFVSVLLK